VRGGRRNSDDDKPKCMQASADTSRELCKNEICINFWSIFSSYSHDNFQESEIPMVFMRSLDYVNLEKSLNEIIDIS
jgi:hypothetical protein